MLDKLQAICNKYEELSAKSEQPDFYADPQKAAKLLREKNDLEPIVEAFHAYNQAQQDMADAQELMADPEMKELCQETYAAAKAQKEALAEKIQILLLPKDPNDEKNVIMEIRGGVGGEESALFAHSLLRMYSMYAAKMGWSIELMNLNETELGGVKEADFIVSGRGAYSRLKYESGVHRVQRVPETESGGRVHTSTATVAVLPEMEEVDVQINPADIEMQVYRSSGAGGQHINKTSSAVRLIHKPTGIVVACQEERSQIQNREKCMRMLASKLYEMEQERLDSEVTGLRRSQVGTGMRNERIRTYNFPQGRVTDHRVGLTLYRIGRRLRRDHQRPRHRRSGGETEKRPSIRKIHMEFITNSPEETEKIGAAIGKIIPAGTVLAYRGDLGAGKTAFTRGLARGLGFTEAVTSPTYTIVNEYLGGRLPLFHFDMYRLSSADDLFDIGWEDYLDRGGVCAVEWSENVTEAMEGAVSVTIDVLGENTRRITISGGDFLADLSL